MNQFICSVVILAVVAFFAEANPHAEDIMVVGQKCQGEQKATAADMEALQKYSMDLTHEAKCVMSCVMKHYGILSADGKMVKDVYMKEAETMAKGDAGMMKHAEDIFQKCSAGGDADICEAAFNYGACMKTEMEARNLKFDM